MISINISGFEDVRNKIMSIDTDKICYDIASSLKAEIKKRVHVRGEASDGSKIGQYSDAYMKVRTGNYPGTALKRGANVGKFRETKKAGQAGVFTRGPRKGQLRPIYNRTNDRSVILSLTSQMERDITIIKVENGYGIGYTNEFNYQKAIWNEERYGKPIWILSDYENKKVQEIVSEYVNDINN